MSKSSIPSSHATRKISRNKSKKQSSIFIDSESSDNFFHPASVASSRGKLPLDSNDCVSSKKNIKFYYLFS